MTISAPVALGFDTSGPYCAAAVVQRGAVLAHGAEDMTKGQAERLMDLLAETMATAGVDYHDLDAIGVGTGPGNFTGIRIAVSAARGLALGLNIPAVGVSAFDALQYGTSGTCTAVVDARRGEVYAQSYDPEGLPLTPALIAREAAAGLAAPVIGSGWEEPKHPAAIAIAHLAAQRFRHVESRPAPLYLRPADAAPARDRGPNILP